jgi:anti-sigma B factor antagonist
MDFETKKMAKYSLVKLLSERLDTVNAPNLKSEFVEINLKGEKNIILDVSNCEYCDASGLSALLVANRLCEDAAGTFVLTGLQPDIEQMIRISMLHTVLPITKTVNEAVILLKTMTLQKEKEEI